MRQSVGSAWALALACAAGLYGTGCGSAASGSHGDAAQLLDGPTSSDGSGGVALSGAGGSAKGGAGGNTGGAQFDARATEVGGLLPDGSVADAPLPQPDDGKGEVVQSQPDGNGVDALALQPDGTVDDTPAPGLDGGTSDTGAWEPDGRTLDAGSLVPDGGASKDEIMGACLLATSCAGAGSRLTPSQCIDRFGLTASRPNDLLFAHLLACAGAKTCNEFRSCWGGDFITLDTVLFGGSCEGNALTTTPTNATLSPVHFDCGAVGGVCELLASNSTGYGCNAISCRGTLGPGPKCEGTTVSGCGGWAEYTSVDCARTGRICRSDGLHAVCDGTAGAACEGSEKVTCAGSVATYCGGSAHTTLDCARTHFRTRCAGGETSWEPCSPADTECDPMSFGGACDGTKVNVCSDGSIVSVDCAAVGLASCEPSSPGHFARCRERT